MSKPIKTAVVMIGALALTIFLFRHQNWDLGTWLAVALVMILIFVAMFIPIIGDFIVERPRAVFWIGIAIVAGGFIGPLGWFAATGHVPAADESDPMQWVTLYAMVIGICLTVLPRTIAAQRRTQPAPERASAGTPPDDSPTVAEFVPLVILGSALAATIAATKALIAAFPTIDAAYLLLGAGLPICAAYYGGLRWWAKRHAQGAGNER